MNAFKLSAIVSFLIPYNSLLVMLTSRSTLLNLFSRYIGVKFCEWTSPITSPQKYIPRKGTLRTNCGSEFWLKTKNCHFEHFHVV
jgi:hypothetical protein